MNYKLDVSREEYRDDYANQTEGELWQIYARDQLVDNLKSILNDAKKYRAFRSSNSSRNDTWLSHNAVLVTSPRGSGKTVFLRNSESMWKNTFQDSEPESKELFFLDVIDPTMLMENDSFANVIVAQIYQSVSDTLNKQSYHCNNSNKHRDIFHHSLKKLADSMGKTSEFNGTVGIDKVLKYSSGIKLESNFHNFVEAAIQLLNCSAIVVSIDDVDMALDRAFEVVDDVRRFLGCPYIIPIVSGDLKLYEHMTQVHFDEKAYDNTCPNSHIRKEGEQLSKDLTTAYLTKVFPSPMRITLFSIDSLLSKMTILEKVSGSESKIEYLDYQERLFNKFNYLCHNRDSRRNWAAPQSARDLTQLVRSIRPNLLVGADQTTSDEIKIQSRYRNWAAQKKNGEAYANSESKITLINSGGKRFSIQDLLSFNIKLQSDSVIYPWAEYEVYKSQEEALKKLYQQGGAKVKNGELIKTCFDDSSKILKPMPPIEFLVDNFFISAKVKKNGRTSTLELSSGNSDYPDYIDVDVDYNEESNEVYSLEYQIEDTLLDIYTEDSLYSTLNNYHKFIFFSRAFEILAYSLLKNDDGKTVFLNVDRIMKSKPFYSVISLAETKIAIEGEEGTEVLKSESDKTLSSVVVYALLDVWKRDNKIVLSKINHINLVPVLSYCFNSVFTAMNVIKGNYSTPTTKSNYDNEHLSDMILRLKYNFLNSLLRSGIYGDAVYANVLVGAKSETVRDEKNIASFERTYYRNKLILENEIKAHSLLDREKTERQQLILDLHDALKSHPVFDIVSSGIVANKYLKIGRGEKGGQKTDRDILKDLLGNEDSVSNVDSIFDEVIGAKVHAVKTINKKIQSHLTDVDVKEKLINISSDLMEDYESVESFDDLSTKYKNFLKVLIDLDLDDVKG